MKWMWDDLDVPPPTQRAWVAAVLITALAFVVIATAFVTGSA